MKENTNLRVSRGAFLHSMILALAVAQGNEASATDEDFTPLHTFDASSPGDVFISQGGSEPTTRPVLGDRGDILGTTNVGGINGTGVIYRYNPYSKDYRVLHHFAALPDPTEGGGANSDGAYPGGDPGVAFIRGPDGVFYGGASQGGQNGTGTIFSVTANGAFKLLHAFDAALYINEMNYNDDGNSPNGLIFGRDGRLYGTTAEGGRYGAGVAWVIAKDGKFTIIHQYTQAEGSAAPLTQGENGYFYGCTTSDSNQGSGILYRMLPSGADFKILHTFEPTNSRGANRDGSGCVMPLIEARSGEFYGTTSAGGTDGQGVVFRYADRRGVKILHSFSSLSSTDTNNDGAFPLAPLTAGPDDALYSTAAAGGTSGSGVIYRISLDGAFSVLYSFGPVDYAEGSSNKDGSFPVAGVIWDPEGGLIGVAQFGGLGTHDHGSGHGNGTLFRLQLALGDRRRPLPSDGP